MAVIIRSQRQRGGLSLFGFVSFVCNNLWGNPEWSTCFLCAFLDLVHCGCCNAQHIVLKKMSEFLQVV